MKLNKVLLLVAITAILLSMGLFVINPGNREVLTQQFSLYGLSFSVMKGLVLAVILAAVVPSAYFTWRYAQIMKQMSDEKRNRGDADVDLKQWEKAGALLLHGQLEAALKLMDGKDGPRHIELKAKILREMGDLEEARDLLYKAFEETSHAELGYLLVDTLEKLEQSPLEILRALVRIDPKNALQARRKLLEYYDKEDDWRACLELIADLEKSGEEIDANQKAAYRYEEILISELPPKNEVDALQQIIKAMPEFVPAALALGDAWMRQGAVEKAFKVYERSFEKTHNPIFLDLIEAFYMEQARPEDAIQIYRELMVRINQPLIKFQLAKLYFKLQMTDECLELLEPMRGALGHIPGYLAYMMQARARRERWDEALDDARLLAESCGFSGQDHICTSCSASYHEWQSRCDQCKKWNTITLEAALVINESVPTPPIAY